MLWEWLEIKTLDYGEIKIQSFRPDFHELFSYNYPYINTPSALSHFTVYYSPKVASGNGGTCIYNTPYSDVRANQKRKLREENRKNSLLDAVMPFPPPSTNAIGTHF